MKTKPRCFMRESARLDTRQRLKCFTGGQRVERMAIKIFDIFKGKMK